ncbi:hypothetical protein KCT17_003657 [Escherichia coli]|nr:hypothetical protein [Escherichia coli]
MTLLDKAVALVNADPLPDDAEEQLDQLAEQASPDERFEIESLGEALFARRYG